MSVHSSRKEVSSLSSKQAVTKPDQQQLEPKLVTSKELILQSTQMSLRVLDTFQVLHTTYSWIQVLHPSRHLVDQSWCTWKKLSTRDWQYAESRVLKPVYKVTPQINSFVLVEGKDKLGNLKLRICLDLTNVNKVIVRELYNFKTPEDIAHLFEYACIMSVCDCKKGYWHQ